MSRLRWLPLGLGLLLAGSLALPVSAGTTLDAIRSRGALRCGSQINEIGISVPDDSGRWIGFEADLCRALATAVLGVPDALKMVPLGSQERLNALKAGEIDVLVRTTTWTLSRDVGMGLSFTAVYYFDGQGFLVPKSLGVGSALQLRKVSVCVSKGTTTERNIRDFDQLHGLELEIRLYETLEAVKAAFLAGRCQVLTTDRMTLAVMRVARAPNPDDYLLLPEIISKEPIAAAVRSDDHEWFDIVRWTLFAVLAAEEDGVSSANVDQLRANPPTPPVARLLGVEGNLGERLHLERDWAYRVVRAVGNYGEIFERNLGAGSRIGLDRGYNKLWNQGGLLYAMPVQ